MTTSEFSIRPAERIGRKARVFLSGVSGSGKSFTALTWAQVLGRHVVVIDTENDSALDYAGDFTFRHLPLRAPYTVQRYIGAMDAAVSDGADVVVVDSVSHAWAGKGGLLELVDRVGGSGDGGKFGAGWKTATPLHLDLIEHMTSLPAHLIVTARSRQEYTLERPPEGGRAQVVKLGMAPVQRDGLEYEFSVTADLTIDHVLTVSKTRCRALDNYSEVKPGTEVAERLLAWLTEGRSVTDQVDAVYMAAQDATTAAELVRLRDSAAPAVLGEMVPAADGGDPVPLGAYIAAKGRQLWAAEQADRQQSTAGQRSA
jgi:hypothetical protein